LKTQVAQTLTAKDKFYGPLKRVAAQYVPLLMARMTVLQDRGNRALEFLEADEEEEKELVWMEDEERVVAVCEAQSQLHKTVIEAAMCQQLVGAFADLLSSDYQKIKESSCFFLNDDGEYESIYEEGLADPDFDAP
jgi:hypothetical protein